MRCGLAPHESILATPTTTSKGFVERRHRGPLSQKALGRTLCTPCNTYVLYTMLFDVSMQLLSCGIAWAILTLGMHFFVHLVATYMYELGLDMLVLPLSESCC